MTDLNRLLLDLLNKYKVESAKTGPNENIELEIRFKDLNREAFENLFTSISTSKEFDKGQLECSINTIVESVRVGPQFIRQIIIQQGAKVKDSFIQKTRLAKPIHFNEMVKYSVGLAREAPSKPVTITNDSLVRFKARVSFDFLGRVSDGSTSPTKWRFDLTAVKTGYLKDIGPIINQIKTDLFPVNLSVDNFLKELKHDQITSYEVEIEHIDKAHIAALNLDDFSIAKKIFTLINPTYMIDIAYQEEVYAVADQILCNRKILPLFKHAYGLKKLGNQPQALTKSSYAKIFPPVGYYLTEKIDGVRCLISVNGNRCRLLTDTLIEIILPDGAATTFIPGELTIADGELVYEGESSKCCDKFSLYIFDCMVYKNENLRYDPFIKREKYLAGAAKIIHQFTISIGSTCVCVKNFVRLEEGRLEGGFREIYEDEFPYKTDGLILTEPDNNYCDMKQYKWKPFELNSIDFIAVKCPQKLLGIKPYEVRPDADLYLLFVGISYDMKERLGLDFVPYYQSMFPNAGQRGEYFPIQFSPSVDPYAYLYYHPKSLPSVDHQPIELRKRIVETAGLRSLEWEFMRVREDRKIEKTYFGNDFRIAELTYMNYIDPFEFEDLWNPKFGYFTKTKIDIYNAPNKYKRFFISMMLKDNFSGFEWIIDEGAGRGADLQRYQELKIGNVLFIDVDTTAIAELIRRKFEFAMFKQGKWSSHKMKSDEITGGQPGMVSKTLTTYDQIHDRTYQKVIEKDLHATVVHTLVADLHTNYATLIDQTKPFGLNPELVDGIVCNFAFHYIGCDTIEHMRNILKFNARMLKQGGIFMLTVLDGEKVFNLLKPLKTGQQWEVKENGTLKYAIKKLYTGDKISPSGQSISVLLPLADEMYEEPICNIDVVIKEAQKLGFEVEVNASFSDKFDLFEKSAKPIYNLLTPDDKKYIDLHRVITLRKMKNISF